MYIYSFLIAASWIALLLVWIIFAFGAKKNTRGMPWWQGPYFRIAIVIVVLLLLHIPTGDHPLRYFGYGSVSENPFIQAIGALLCLLGVAFAIWARVCLGRNWGMPMTLKENTELVTKGPYAYVRHPIYSGILLAIFGSLFAYGFVWVIPLVVFFLYFIYSATTEEKIMTKQFPTIYPEYKKRTKMLIPFVW